MEYMKLIIEKGPSQGETLQYTSRSVVKIGRVVRGNTVAIKDAGISSKHICIKFDSQLNKWTLSDLDSANGTVLNGKTLNPNLPCVLNDNDCIKIGEFTSIVVKFGVDSSVRSDRICEFGGGTGSDGEMGGNELGLGFGENLGGNAGGKRNLRSRGKKGVSFKNDLESFIPVGMRVVTEDLNIDVRETINVVNVSGMVEPRMTRGMKRKLSAQQLTECTDLERKPAAAKDGKKARRGRKVVTLEGNLDNADESVQVDDANEIGMGRSENVESCSLEESLKTKSGSVQDDLVKDATGQWVDLEKITLGDFFDYLEVQLPKEILDKSDKVIADLLDMAQKCHEFRLQRNKDGMGKLATD